MFMEEIEKIDTKQYIDWLKLKIWDTPSYSQLAELTKNAIKFLSKNDDFKVLSSWLIVNLSSKNCKWYCNSNLWVPLVCSKFENCNNFNRASSIAVELNTYEHRKKLDDIY